jgi:limonene-1,2-epoxide hydrolase
LRFAAPTFYFGGNGLSKAFTGSNELNTLLTPGLPDTANANFKQKKRAPEGARLFVRRTGTAVT